MMQGFVLPFVLQMNRCHFYGKIKSRMKERSSKAQSNLTAEVLMLKHCPATKVANLHSTPFVIDWFSFCPFNVAV